MSIPILFFNSEVVSYKYRCIFSMLSCKAINLSDEEKIRFLFVPHQASQTAQDIKKAKLQKSENYPIFLSHAIRHFSHCRTNRQQRKTTITKSKEENIAKLLLSSSSDNGNNLD